MNLSLLFYAFLLVGGYRNIASVARVSWTGWGFPRKNCCVSNNSCLRRPGNSKWRYIKLGEIKGNVLSRVVSMS